MAIICSISFFFSWLHGNSILGCRYVTMPQYAFCFQSFRQSRLEVYFFKMVIEIEFRCVFIG